MRYRQLREILDVALKAYEAKVESEYCVFRGPEGKRAFPTDYVGSALGLPRNRINELSLAERLLDLKTLTND
jgi:hypothetical protein